MAAAPAEGLLRLQQRTGRERVLRRKIPIYLIGKIGEEAGHASRTSGRDGGPMTEEEKCVGLAARRAGTGDEIGAMVTCRGRLGNRGSSSPAFRKAHSSPIRARERSGPRSPASRRRDANVLITGETGTGKELVARARPRREPRARRALRRRQLRRPARHLVESELFGHERGAFTGAGASTPGWFERADGGTLFLDEIGELPPALQPKLLRVLQERRGAAVGARQPRPLDVRADHRDQRRPPRVRGAKGRAEVS